MPQLRIFLLDSFQVTSGDERMLQFRSAKDRALLAYLAVEAGRPHSRDSLAALLWPETIDANARSNLRYTLSSLRRSIGDKDTDPPFLIVTPDAIQFNTASHAWVDVRELERGLAQGQLFDAGRAEAALAYFRGPFLAGFSLSGCPEFEDWLLLRREQINRQALEALGRLAGHYERRREYGRALAFARRQIEIEPWDEAAQRQAMRLLALSGQRAKALAQYETLRKVLREELNVEPEAETERLVEQIRQQTLRPDLSLAAGHPLRGFELVERIGAGHMGEVYRAYQPGVGRDVAIKIIQPGYADRPEFIRRFEMEARLVARLEHPHIVPLYDFWREPGGAFLVMRWLQGGSLADSLDAGFWPADAAVRLMLQTASALHLAHQSGVIHRDIKPANILLDEAGNGYLSDFGIAALLEPLAGGNGHKGESPQDDTIGSLGYTSPELLDGAAPTPAADIYSLGIVLFELLTARAPFPDLPPDQLIAKHRAEALPPLQAFRPDLPSPVDAVIQQATAKRPQERFPDALTLAYAFQQAIHPRAKFVSALALDDANLPNPYKGLRAFEEADEAEFFGRRELIEHLLARLAAPEPYGRFLAVVGPSGSGKSSLIRAGLMPRLRRGALPGSDRWYVLTMTPGSQPFAKLALGLLQMSTDPLSDLANRLRQNDDCLLQTADAILPEQAELLLIIDQFEELYTAVPDADERDRFLRTLCTAVTAAGSRLRVLIGLRADFYDRPLMHPDLSRLLQQRTEVVVPLSAAELTEAITEPARRVGVSLEEGLSAALVAGVNEQPGALPLLQYALTELFQRREGRLLTHAAYEAIGGVAGALAQRAESAYLALEPPAQAAARQIFLRLVALGEGEDDTRRRVAQAELLTIAGDAVGGAVLEVFGSDRLLTFDREPATRQPTVEVAHEALLREWARLRAWLDESRADLRLERMLARSAEEWLAAQRDASFLLRGSRLAQLQEWVQATDLALTGDERAYLQASLAGRAQEEAAEEARQARERQLERRSRNRLRAAAGVLALAAVVALALSLFALRQRDDALQAYSLSLTANAQEALKDGDPATALALALVAANIDDPPLLARQTLLDAAYAPGARRRYDAATLFPAAQGPATALALSPAGRTVLIGFGDGQIAGWDWQDERETVPFAAHSAPVNAIVVAPDGNTLLSAADDGLIVQWDLATGGRLRQLAGHSGPVRALDISRDGRLAVSGSFAGQDYDAPGELFLWDLDAGEIIRRFEGHAKGVVQARFVLDDSAILASSGDLALLVDRGGSGAGGVLSDHILWDATTGDRLSTLNALEHDASVIMPLLDGSQALIGSYYDNVASLVDLADGRVVQRLAGHSDAVETLVVSAGGEQALSGSADQSLILWNLQTGQALYRLYGHGGPVVAAVVAPDFRTALSLGSDGELLRWDLHDAMEMRRFIGHGDMVYDVAVMPDQQHILSVSGSSGPAMPSQDTSLRLWEIASGQQLISQTVSAPVIYQVDVTPDGRTILADNTLYDAAGLAPIGQLAGHAEGAWVPAIDISPDGARALSGSVDGTLILWDLASRQPLCRIEPGVAGGIWSAEFSPDGGATLTESTDGVMGLWDLAGCVHVRDYGADLTPGLDVSHALFHPDGQSVFGAAGDGFIYQFERESGRLIRTFGPHKDIRIRMAISPDGCLMLSSGMDGVLMLRDLQSGDLIRRFGKPGSVIFDVTMAPDGRTAFSGSSDRAIVQWELSNPSLDDLREWIKANRHVRDLSCEERALYDVKPLCQ